VKKKEEKTREAKAPNGGHTVVAEIVENARRALMRAIFDNGTCREKKRIRERN
jgi:hypothetical protein